MSTVTLKTATPEDARTLAYIQTESWKSAFRGILSDENLGQRTSLEKTEAMYQRVLADPAMHLTIETVDEKPHCIACWSRNRAGLGETVAELICIHSLPDNWRRGYGSMMMELVLAEMKAAGYIEVILWVFEKNTRARGFYEKHGFTAGMQAQNNFGAVEMMYSRKL